MHVNSTAHFLLAQYFCQEATNAFKTYICPACVCMSIRLHISLVVVVVITCFVVVVVVGNRFCDRKKM